jgi:hypothetical protein
MTGGALGTLGRSHLDACAQGSCIGLRCGDTRCMCVLPALQRLRRCTQLADCRLPWQSLPVHVSFSVNIKAFKPMASPSNERVGLADSSAN